MNRRIHRARISKPRGYPQILDDLRRLDEVVRSGDTQRIRAEITRQVSSYCPDTGCLNGGPTASGPAEYPPTAQAVPHEEPTERLREKRKSPDLAGAVDAAKGGE